MLIKESVRKRVVTVPPGATLSEAAVLMNVEVVGALVVVENGRAVGIVTDRDIAVRGAGRGLPPDARVDSVMTPDPVTLSADAEDREAFLLMHAHNVRRLPLVTDGRVVGMVTVDDMILDLMNNLGSVLYPVFGQVVFGQPDPNVPLPVEL